MKSIRVYEIATISEENAEILHLKTHFYWSTEAFGNIEEGDGLFVVNNKTRKVFFSIVERIDISYNAIRTMAEVKNSPLTTKANNKSWGDFTKLRIINEVDTDGDLNMRLRQKKVFILYKEKKSEFPPEKKELALYRIDLLRKQFKNAYVRRLLEYCISYLNGKPQKIVHPLPDDTHLRQSRNTSLFNWGKKDVISQLQEFSGEANQWFFNNNRLQERYTFFKEFFRESNLKKATWKEFQLVGKNLQSFNYNRLRLNAWGRTPSHSIPHYRKVFTYIAHHPDSIDLKLAKLLDKNSKYYLQHLYAPSITELIMYAIPNKYFFYNKRSEKVLSHLGLELKPYRGEPFGEFYKRYNQELEHIKQQYLQIVKKRTNTTVQLEVDQFLNWYYEKNIKPTEAGFSHVRNTIKSRSESEEEIEYVSEPLEAENIEFIGKPKQNRIEKYSDSNAEAEIFIPSSDWNRMKNVLQRKKNIILQGPPGVGKTFAAKRLAYNILGAIDRSKIEIVQFHQSYAYEDFIQGIRPEGQGFKINGGSFFNFCQRAAEDPENKYFFIIEEINRGNLARIFGELMLLVESDKRGADNAISLTYSKENETFYVPENVYIIGTMNTADRSLSMVDYALRRRFSFMDLEPCYDEKFKSHLSDKGVSVELIDNISKKIGTLNKLISQDEKKLGKGFRIGHSYFCSPTQDNHDQWYKDIIELEIQPLLEEYWFDESKKAYEQVKHLLDGIK